ncbi:MAG TPA: hypothetical protein PLO51_03120 [Candidatus Micrarchaeota archaeon]|nr:hypothetical protein [Candidatus Micrarchaeota archaeon]
MTNALLDSTLNGNASNQVTEGNAGAGGNGSRGRTYMNNFTPLESLERFANGAKNGNTASALRKLSGGFWSKDWKAELENMMKNAPEKGAIGAMLEAGYDRFVQMHPNMPLKLNRKAIMSNPMAVKSFMLVYTGSKPASIIGIENFEGNFESKCVPFKIYSTKENTPVFYAYDGENKLVVSKSDMLLKKILYEFANVYANGPSKAKPDFDRTVGVSLGFPPNAVRAMSKGGPAAESYYNSMSQNNVQVQPETFLPIFVPEIKYCEIQDMGLLAKWDGEFAKAVPLELYTAYQFMAKIENLGFIGKQSKE